MILKVKKDSIGEGTWYFYDNISWAKMHTNRKPPDNWSNKEDIIDLLPQGIAENASVQIMYLHFLNGLEKFIRFAKGTAYLLNDDGKTIERL